MLQQLLLAFLLTAVTVGIHVVGIVRGVAPAVGVWRTRFAPHAPLAPVKTLTLLVAGLLMLHLVEVAVWAAAFAFDSVLPDFETSLYYSLTSYTTVGYGDVVPSENWRLLGPIEAAVGILMLGLSTSVTVAAVQRVYSVYDAGSH